MTDTTKVDWDALDALREKATDYGEGCLIRYEHGGGRVALLSDKERKLIADFYDEGNREYYHAMRPTTYDAIKAEREALQERVRVLEDVLGPITTACEQDCTGPETDDEPDDEPVAMSSTGTSALTFGHIRAARAALEEK